jgi:putative transposase
MAWDHPTWGEKRFATDLVLKLGLRISPHTVRTYLPTPLPRARHHRLSSQRWLTCGRKHAKAMVAGEFWSVVAATCRLLLHQDYCRQQKAA